MTKWNLIVFQSLSLVALLCSGNSISEAACSSKVIKALNDGGKGVTAISRICDMTREAVLDALRQNDDSDDGNDDDTNSGDSSTPSRLPRGFRSGTPITGCGCWGAVAPGATVANPSCASGLEHAQQCLGFCPAGGSPWARVCN